MRITVIDIDDAGDAVAAIQAALGRNGTVQAAEQRAIEAPKKRRRESIASEKIDLSDALSHTWNWLVANDRRKGHTAIEVAEALSVKTATANYRLNALIDHGLAHRVSRGFFRAGEKR